jgi:hypothetical protein
MRRSGIAPPEALSRPRRNVIAGSLAFVWLNGVLLRTLSHWAGIRTPTTR